MPSIVKLDYPINRNALLIDAEKARETAELHGGPKTQEAGKWLISYYENARIKKIMKDEYLLVYIDKEFYGILNITDVLWKIKKEGLND